MESDDSCEGLVEVIPNNQAAGSIITNGMVSMAPRTLKTEQVYQHITDFHPENLVSCSSAPANMVQMGTVINQNGQLQPAMMTMTDPNNPNMPEQLVVVQNVNGAGTLDEASAKTMINAGSLPGSIQMAKFANPPTSMASMLPQMTNGGQMIAPTQLAGMMNLAGLPQVTTLTGLNGIPGLNVMNQIQGQPQLVQQQTNNGTTCVQNTQIQGACPQNMVSVNGHPNAVQQSQVGNQPQFILAGGQPIQGIQGAQLLIPTSSEENGETEL